MKLAQKIQAGAVALAAVVALSISGAAVAENIRVAGNFNTDHSSSIAMAKFAEELATMSKGGLTADIFPAMQLGGAKENVDQVRSGAIFATWLGLAYLSRTVPELEAVTLPFVFTDRAKVFKIVDGKIGDMLDERLADKGFKTLGYMELGPRHISNRVRPIKTMADLQGLKIRLQPNETHLATFRALGANPVAMGIKEVYSALQQGVLDGQENPYAAIKSSKFNEVTTYLSDSNHFFDFIILVANKKAFDKLSPENQTAVLGAAKKSITWQRAQAAEEEVTSKQALIDGGMIFDSIPDAERAKMIAASAPVIEDMKTRLGADLINAVLAEAN